jgi:alkanesulfonate monooxygenase SsuD/methylene tetrahydromethanopterin reductase-like flavin-dependent oxidoreductase (luciferase family)
MEFWQSIAFTETDQLIEIAKIAEAVGFAGLNMAEHLVTPEVITSKYPYSPDGTARWDEKATSRAVGARVDARIAHAHLEVRDEHLHPPDARRVQRGESVSTAVYLTNNRVVLGVGAGWMKEEFLLTGQDFHTRGRRMDEMLEVMSKLFAGGMVEHHGEFFDFPRVQMEPAPTEPVPVLIGGHSDVALRRAARWDGWFAAGPYAVDELVGYLERLRDIRTTAGTAHRPYQIIAGLWEWPSIDDAKRLADLGLTGLVKIPWYFEGVQTSTIEYKRETMERFAEQYIEPLRTV